MDLILITLISAIILTIGFIFSVFNEKSKKVIISIIKSFPANLFFLITLFFIFYIVFINILCFITKDSSCGAYSILSANLIFSFLYIISAIITLICIKFFSGKRFKK